MGEHNSPYFAAGTEDATLDAEMVSSCPSVEPAGPDPDKQWSIMYMRGYNSVPQFPHVCDRSCAK